MLTTSFNGRNPTLCSNGRNSIIVFHDPTSKSPLHVRIPSSQNHGRAPTSQHHCRTQLQSSTSMADNPTICLHGPKSTPNSLFKNLQILRTIASGHDVIHTPASFFIWVFMTIVIAISFAHERKLYPMLCTWTKSRIVQSPTKVNDKI